jgi:hypothetical protein
MLDAEGFGGRFTVGANSFAKASRQPPMMLNVPALSRMNSLPQIFMLNAF